MSSLYAELGFALGGTGVATQATIRDRIHDLLEALILPWDTKTHLRRYRNEGDGNFQNWAEANPAGALRRFQVRADGTEDPPEVSNTDYDMRHVTFVVRVAYPQTGRYGADGALDRDDVMDQDFGEIEKMIGIYGRGWFFGTFDATPLGLTKSTEIGASVDFLVLTARFSYYREVNEIA